MKVKVKITVLFSISYLVCGYDQKDTSRQTHKGHRGIGIFFHDGVGVFAFFHTFFHCLTHILLRMMRIVREDDLALFVVESWPFPVISSGGVHHRFIQIGRHSRRFVLLRLVLCFLFWRNRENRGNPEAILSNDPYRSFPSVPHRLVELGNLR